MLFLKWTLVRYDSIPGIHLVFIVDISTKWRYCLLMATIMVKEENLDRHLYNLIGYL
jgi:hypothetical protein